MSQIMKSVKKILRIFKRETMI